MSENDWWKDLKGRLKFFATQVVQILIDSLYLALWVIAQWAVNEYVVQRLKLSGMDEWVYLAFQVIFALSTLVVVVLHVGADIVIMYLRTRRRIQYEVELSKGTEGEEYG